MHGFCRGNFALLVCLSLLGNSTQAACPPLCPSAAGLSRFLLLNTQALANEEIFAKNIPTGSTRHDRHEVTDELWSPYTLPWGNGKEPTVPSVKILKVFNHAVRFLAPRDPLPHHAEWLLVTGNDDLKSARDAAAIYWKDPAAKHPRVDRVLIVGGRGRHTPEEWTTEAAAYKAEMVKAGVPESVIILDEESTNSGQNITNAKEIMFKLGRRRLPKTVILVQSPVHLRRMSLTARKQFGPRVRIIPYASYLPDLLQMTPNARARVLKEVVGELYRLLEYQKPELDYLEPIDVPETDLQASLAIAEHLRQDPSLTAADRTHLENYTVVIEERLNQLNLFNFPPHYLALGTGMESGRRYQRMLLEIEELGRKFEMVADAAARLIESSYPADHTMAQMANADNHKRLEQIAEKIKHLHTLRTLDASLEDAEFYRPWLGQLTTRLGKRDRMSLSRIMSDLNEVLAECETAFKAAHPSVLEFAERPTEVHWRGQFTRVESGNTADRAIQEWIASVRSIIWKSLAEALESPEMPADLITLRVSNAIYLFFSTHNKTLHTLPAPWFAALGAA